MLWLLYPMIVGFMILIDQDIENLIAAYTPTMLVAAVFASGLNNHRFWFTDTTALLAFGFLALLWARYLVGELELLPERQTPILRNNKLHLRRNSIATISSIF